MTGQLFTLFVVEDDVVDATAIKRAVAKHHADIELVIHSTASEALEDELLTGATRGQSLVIIDLNLPGIGGHELVRRLNRLPIPPPMVILTTSADRHDQTTAWHNGVAGYFLKPIESPAWSELINTILCYWRQCHFQVPE